MIRPLGVPIRPGVRILRGPLPTEQAHWVNLEDEDKARAHLARVLGCELRHVAHVRKMGGSHRFDMLGVTYRVYYDGEVTREAAA